MTGLEVTEPPAPVRVRFAPSPTGYFHVGSARTALFNWLFARQASGTFILRIEDTDTERGREEWVGGILTAMQWLGLSPDEGPYRQSEHAERYRVAIEALWESGYLYACECTRQEIDARNEAARSAAAPGSAPVTPGYDGYCRDRGLDRGPGRALRFRTPRQGEVTVVDLVRGEVTFPNAAIEDFVCVKSSGDPLFVLANVIDDRDMAISHVIRGEDLLPSTPKGILLWQALDESAEGESGWGERTRLPVYAHLPMLVNEQRKKLSKRRDPVAVESYRDKGYLPEAFRNYLALLGWSPPGDAEKVPLEVLIETFRLEDVHHAPAFFDVVKLTHLNGDYIRELSVDRFVELSRPWVDPDPAQWSPPERPPWPPERFDPGVFRRMAPMVQERVATLGESASMVDFIFLNEPEIDQDDWRKTVLGDPGAPAILAAAATRYATVDWTAEALHGATLGLAEEAGLKLGKAQAPIRVAITGRRVGPPLFESLEVLGRQVVLSRLERALARAEATTPATTGASEPSEVSGSAGAAGLAGSADGSQPGNGSDATGSGAGGT